MANTVRLKRSAVQGKAPTTSDLELGELAVNTYDGKLYTKKNDGSDAIVEIGAGSQGTDLSYTQSTNELASSSGTNVTLPLAGASANEDGLMSHEDKAKLDGIETGATADQSKADIDALNINADQVDGLEASSFLRSDANDTAIGLLDFDAGVRFTTTNAGGNGISFVDNGYQTRWDGRETLTNQTVVHKYSRQGNNTGSFNAYVENWYDGTSYHSIGLNSSGVLQYDSNTVWHAGNDGSGSGLDADTVDSLHASSFLRSDANDTATGQIILSGGVSTNGKDFYSSGGALIAGDANGAFADRTGSNIDHLHHDDSTNTWHFCSDTTYKANGNSTVQAAAFTGSGANLTNVNAATLDSIDSSQFLRSDADDTATGEISFTSGIKVSGSFSTDTQGSEIVIEGDSPQITFSDTNSNSDDFYIHVNSDSFYVLVDRDDNAGAWESPFPLQLRATDDTAFAFGNRILTTADEGSGNGLDADTLDGQEPSVSVVGSSIVQRHSSGYIYANYFNTTPNTVTDGSTITQVCIETGNDGFIRHGTADAIREFLAEEATLTSAAWDISTSNNWTSSTSFTVAAPSGAVTGLTGVFRITAGTLVWNSVFKFPDGVAPTITSYPAIIPYYVQDSSNILMGNVTEGIT